MRRGVLRLGRNKLIAIGIYGGLMFGLGFQELLIILIIALIIFGPAKLPQIGSGLGKAIRDFRKGVKEEEPGGEIHEEKTAKKDDAKELSE
jgi:sec-independent protein translocase protein TatA